MAAPEAEGKKRRDRWRDRYLEGYRKVSAFMFPVSAIIGIVLGVRELFGLDGPGWAVVLAVFDALLVVAVVVALYAEQHRHRKELAGLGEVHNAELAKYQRNARVAVALPTIHDAYHCLRDAAVRMHEGDTEHAVQERLIQSLSHMTRAFSAITGAPCRMSVKELHATPDAPDRADAAADVRFFEVGTCYRHDGSTNAVTDAPTPPGENADFRNVWDPEQTDRCFFANDIDAVRGYVNPHRQGDPKEFSYNSTIVWPIQSRRDRTRVGLFGYLCVDSKQKGIFEYHNDFDLGAAYADSLYSVLAVARQAHPPAAERRPDEASGAA